MSGAERMGLEAAATAIAGRFVPPGRRDALAHAIVLLAAAERERPLRRGCIEIDLLARTARCRDRPVPLMPREFTLLLALVRAPAPLDMAALRQAVLGIGFDPGTNAVAVHLSRLRAKLGAGVIETVPSAGWRLRDGPISEAIGSPSLPSR